MNEDIENVQRAVENIVEGVADLTNDLTATSVDVEHVKEKLDRVSTLVEGTVDGRPGLVTRVALLEDAERKRAPIDLGGASAIVAVENAKAAAAKAEAEATKTRWESAKDIVGKAGPWVLALIALASQVAKWLTDGAGAAGK